MPNKVTDEKFAAMIHALCYWLGYQFQIGREQLIDEASLRYPIADVITAKGTAIGRVVLEKLHPIFKGKKIDLVIYHKNVQNPQTEKNDNKLEEVYEFKLAKIETSKETNIEHQRVFNDVVRLAYYNMWSKKSCYFLMCGTYENFKTYFVGQKSGIGEDENGKSVVPETHSKTNKQQPTFTEWEPDGLYKNWFSFSIGEPKIVEFNDSKLKTFQDQYTVNDEKLKYENSIKIKTTCLAVTPINDKNKTHAAGIWKIEGIKTRRIKRK